MRHSTRFLAFLAISVYFILSLESKGAEADQILVDSDSIAQIHLK